MRGFRQQCSTEEIVHAGGGGGGLKRFFHCFSKRDGKG